MTSNRYKIIIIILFTIGLIIRIFLIDTHGSSDLEEYIRWGKNTYESGLSKAFEGAYFPIQYQSFEISYAIANYYSISTESVIKIVNLIFELGELFILIYILKKYLSIQKIIIYFWLNPFMFIIHQQGYVDSQFSFFILLTLAILTIQNNNVSKYLISGIPLGISLLMKPQSAPIFVGLGILVFIFFIFKQKKEIHKVLVIFIAPFILYTTFSLYFGFTLDIHNNHKTLPKISSTIQETIGLPERPSDIIANSLFLTSQYVYTATKRMPAINAYMANPWFFVAESLRTNNMPIYRVEDTNKFFGLSYRTWGEILFTVAFLTIALKIFFSSQTLDKKILLIICVIPILIPYLGTSAHENHFYLGFIFTIMIGAWLSDRIIINAGYLLGSINGVHLFYLYIIPYYLHITYEITERMVIIGTSSIIFLILLYYLMFKTYYGSITEQKILQ